MRPTNPAFTELRLDRLSRSFGRVQALRDVSLAVRRGEFIALLGPSGCGKSTALYCIAGLLAVSGGSIWLDDRRIDGLRPEARGFGMVFQNYALFPHMNARRNVGFGLKMRRVAAAESTRRVEAALALVRLQGQADRLPAELSGGQQQRVAIARAIVVEPPLVLMDEPLSNLDAKLRLEMRFEIRRIHDELHSTTIYVTHDQDEALSLADRIVVMRDGTIRQVGSPSELYETPAHLDVAEFMGFRNRFAGRLVGREGDRAIVEAEGVRLAGVLRAPLADGAAAVLTVRPDDLTVGAPGATAVAAVVETIEYRGREFVGTAFTAKGTELVFHSREALAHRGPVHLVADERRALIYPAEAAG